MKTMRFLACSLLALGAATAATRTHAEDGFYQYPSARGDVLVFASEGDLWRTGREGGSAIRLTNHPAEETDAHVSPDGTMVAFTASYDSEQDVYVMPVAGGTPRRLTFEGGLLRTVGWTPDGRVIYSSRLTGGGHGEILYTIAPTGGEASPIPLWRANDATYGADGTTLFFSRRGLTARARDHAVLYRGGGMAQLWRWDGGAADEAVQLLPDFGAPIRFPMAADGKVYFVSDKSGGDALWSVNEDGSGVVQLSQEMPFPILQASLDGDAIYLQNGADIHVFSRTDSSLHTLAIDIVTDRAQTRLRAIADPMSQLEGAHISPSGESVAVTARGRVALARGQVEGAVPPDQRHLDPEDLVPHERLRSFEEAVEVALRPHVVEGAEQGPGDVAHDALGREDDPSRVQRHRSGHRLVGDHVPLRALERDGRRGPPAAPAELPREAGRPRGRVHLRRVPPAHHRRDLRRGRHVGGGRRRYDVAAPRPSR